MARFVGLLAAVLCAACARGDPAAASGAGGGEEQESCALLQSRHGASSASTLGDAASHAERHALYTEVEQMRSDGNEDAVMEVMMSKPETALLDQFLGGASRYMEFGMGGSTVFALHHKNLQCVKSVESSPEWMDKVSKRHDVSAAMAAHRVKLVHVDIGPTVKLGFPKGWPKDNSTSDKWPAYSQQSISDGWCGSGTAGGKLVVLVDGRFRVACFLRSLAAVEEKDRASTELLIHDYERKWYHVVEEFADETARVGRLAAFRKKAGVDPDRVERLIKQYEKEPKA